MWNDTVPDRRSTMEMELVLMILGMNVSPLKEYCTFGVGAIRVRLYFGGEHGKKLLKLFMIELGLMHKRMYLQLYCGVCESDHQARGFIATWWIFSR